MPYITPDKLRDEILGVDSDDAPDSVLNSYITKSDKTVLQDISTEVILEEIYGSIDDSNKEFSLDYYPIADRDADGAVTVSDVTIKGWRVNSNVLFDELTVDSVLADKGIIMLESAPSAAVYDTITADYRYYTGHVDYDLIETASGQYAAFLWLLKEHSLMPLKLKMGGRRGMETSYGYTVPTYPYDKMLEQYHFTLDKIRSKLHKTIRMDKMVGTERELDGVSR